MRYSVLMLGWLWASAVAGTAASAQTTQPGDAVRRPPATAPDLSLRLEPAQKAQVQRIIDKLGLRRWGPPHVERYDQPGARADWQVQNGKCQIRDGVLVFESPQPNAPMQFWARRSLPANLDGAQGIRIEAWLEMDRPPQNQQFTQAAIYLTAAGAQLTQWDCLYYFALGQQGSQQMLQWVGGVGAQSGLAKPIEPNKPMRVVLEVIDTRARGQRDAHPAVVSVRPMGLRLTDRSAVGLVGMGSQIRLLRLAHRTLAPTLDAAERANLWAGGPFAGEKELNAFLADKVIPRLDHPDFAVRQQATELLWSLLPVSRPAVKAAIAGAVSPEAKWRLEAISAGTPKVTVLPEPGAPQDGVPPVINRPQPAAPPASRPAAPRPPRKPPATQATTRP